MFLVEFTFEDDAPIFVQAKEGENLMQAAKRAGIPLNTDCSGAGTCGRCRVRIVRGALASSKSFYIDDVEYDQGWRLACISRICGDVTLYVG